MNAQELTVALNGKWAGKSGTSRCPAHDDKSPSFSIADGKNGAPVLHCHGGCSQDAVLDALRVRGLWPERRDAAHQPRTPARKCAPTPADTAPDFVSILKTAPAATWTYYTADGRLIGYVARVNNPDGTKTVLPVTWDESKGWINRAFSEPRPLYNLHSLAANPTKPVLIVEGEKTAEAAQHLVDLVVTTWPGGGNAVAKVDLTPLKGRHVVLWPDADEPGRKAMRALADRLTDAASVKGVKLPEGLPKGWDLADALPADLDPVAMIGRAVDLRAARLTELKITNAAALVARTFKPPKWAVPDYVPEGLSILAGRPKTGKSWLTLDFAVGVASGTTAMGNVECDAGDVLALLLEDTDRRLSGRLKAVLQGAPAPERLHIATNWRKADDGGLDDLRTWLSQYPEARLVIIDTLAMIRGKADRDGGVYRDDYNAVSGFKKLADEFCVPFILVHHLRKESATDPLDSVSGTAGLTGSADTILVLKREPNDPHALLYVRGRDVIEAEVALQFDNDAGKWTRLGAGDDFRKTEERREVIRALKEGGAMTPGDIASVTGKKAGNVRAMLLRMRKDGEISRLANGRYQYGG